MIVACDGAARGNPGPAGIGVQVTDEDGRILEELAEGIGVATNNQAEYRAVIAGLEIAARRGARHVLVRSDSRLLVEQLAGRFRVKNSTLQRLHTEVRRVAEGFQEVAYEHVPRAANAEADRLANEGVDVWLATEEGQAWSPPGPAPSLLEPD